MQVQVCESAPKMAWWYVYMVRCKDGTLYTGATNDLQKRLAAHNTGRGARYTRSRRPVSLVYSRRVRNRSRALSVEARLKQLTRLEKHSLIAKNRPLARIVNAPALF